VLNVLATKWATHVTACTGRVAAEPETAHDSLPCSGL
jgi:hypothetical protein